MDENLKRRMEEEGAKSLADEFDEVKFRVETEDGMKERYADDYEVSIRVVHFFIEDDEKVMVRTVPIDKIYEIIHIREK